MSDQTNFKLFDDFPVESSSKDNFEHGIYAEILSEIIKDNKAGIAIALFGKWGQGKSTIVNLLQERLGDTQVIIFNAWKAKGDSVRRQLLLTVLEAIAPDKAKELKKFAGLELAFELIHTQKEQREKQNLASMKAIPNFFRENKKSLPLWISFMSIVGIIFLSSYAESYLLKILTNFLLIPALGGIAAYVWKLLEKSYSGILGISEPISESQRLKYPEQFKELFADELNKYFSKPDSKDLLIVIDDLDRCEPLSIVEALSSIRQFSDSKDIQEAQRNKKSYKFLVPCDEEQVVLALESDGHSSQEDNRHDGGTKLHDYSSEELLKKFFDVTVRMDKFLQGDLSNYAEEIAPHIGIETNDAKELIDMVRASNPRQIKKLLNAYKIAKARLIKSQQRNLLPPDEEMPKLTRTLMAIVALRETVPQIYKEIRNDLNWIQEIDEKEINTSTRNAKAILERAGEISPITSEYIISGQYEKNLRGIPNASAFRESTRTSNHEKFSDNLEKETSENRKKLIDWSCTDLTQHPTMSRVAGYLSLAIGYGSQDNDKSKGIAQLIETCVTLHGGKRINEILSNYDNYDRLELCFDPIQEYPKQIIIKSVLNSLLSSAEHRKEKFYGAELKFLFSTIKYIETSERERFIHELENITNDNEQLMLALRFISLHLPEDKEKINGCLPEIAKKLAEYPKWIECDEELNPEENKPVSTVPRFKLITIFTGTNPESATECIHLILAGALKEATSNKQNLVAWSVIIHFLKTVNFTSPPFGSTEIIPWLNSGAFSNDAMKVITNKAILPSSIEEKEMQNFTNALCSIYSIDAIPNILGEKPENEQASHNWEQLSKSITSNLFDGYKQKQFEDDIGKFLDLIHNNQWPVLQEIDDLLAHKIRSSSPNINLWIEKTLPFFHPPFSLPKSQQAILTIAESIQTMQQAFSIGKHLIWKTSIAPSNANSIANACIKNPPINNDYNLIYLIETEGGTKIVEDIMELMPGGLPEIKQKSQLIEHIAPHIYLVKNINLQKEFQGKMRKMLIDSDASSNLTGLKILSSCDKLIDNVKKEVEERYKENENEEIAQLAKEILEKPSF